MAGGRRAACQDRKTSAAHGPEILAAAAAAHYHRFPRWRGGLRRTDSPRRRGGGGGDGWGGGDGSGVPSHVPSSYSSQHIFSASHSLLYVTPSMQHTGKYSRVQTWLGSGTHGGEGGGFV